MEVHRHAHSDRKKWTHYFWEFLMLFLAVFCGFLAELQLEHYIEDQREKKFAVQLLSDLKEDTSSYHRLIEKIEIDLARYDSACKVYTNKPDMTDDGFARLSRRLFVTFNFLISLLHSTR